MYLFYIDDVLMPVTPSEMTTKIKNQNKTITLADGTEHNLVKLPGLSEVSFDVLLPRVKYPFAVYENGEFTNAEYYLSLFESLKVQRRVFDLRIVRNIGMEGTERKCTLEDYSIKEKAANGVDVVVSLKLKYYEFRKTKTYDFAASEGNEVVEEEQRPVSKETETVSYTVVSGDTLWGIAKRYLGDGSRHKEVYEENKDVIEAAAKKYGRASSTEGWWIYPGTVLTIKGAIK